MTTIRQVRMLVGNEGEISQRERSCPGCVRELASSAIIVVTYLHPSVERQLSTIKNQKSPLVGEFYGMPVYLSKRTG